MYYQSLDLTLRTVSSSFPNFVEVTGSILVNGVGISFFDLSSSAVLPVSVSWASQSLSASYVTGSNSVLGSLTASNVAVGNSIISSVNGSSIQMNNTLMLDNNNELSIDWNGRSLTDALGEDTIEWANGYLIADNDGAYFNSVDWFNRFLLYLSGSGTMHPSAMTSLDWQNFILYGQWTGSISNAISASWASQSFSSSHSTSASYAPSVSQVSCSWASQSLSSSALIGNYPAIAQNYILTGSYTNTQTSNYSLASSDNGKLVIINASVQTFVTASTTLPQGFACSILQFGTGKTTVTGSTGVSIFNRASLSSSFGQYSIISLIQVSPLTYILQGDVG